MAQAEDLTTRMDADIESLQVENEALRSMLELRDRAMDATPSFFVITEIVQPEALVVYCNQAVADQHGLHRDELVGTPTRLLTPWADKNPDYLASVETTLRAGHVFKYEDKMTRKDGRTVWLGISIHPLFSRSGNLTHTVIVGADITVRLAEIQKRQALQDELMEEMKRRERMGVELQLAQKLESVGRLAAGIAHEINTPIQYVANSVDFLRSAHEDMTALLTDWETAIDAAEGDPALRAKLAALQVRYDMGFIRAEAPRAFERTFEGVQRVTNIVKAMKEFAHPDTHEQSPADVNRAIETTLLVASNEYRYLATVSTEWGDLPQVVCNIGELNQVFLNLIVNAAHAIADAGKDLTNGEIKLRTSLEGSHVLIRVSDNGCGVAPENLSKLYDPFFTTKEVGRGSGQGLAIAHSIVVDKHQGDISATSTPGQGTEFTLRLPVNGRAVETSV
jgi:two-component system, NtrC family, sensor kinase